MKVLFATTNPAKVKKYKNVLEEKGIQLLTLKDLDINIKVEETGKNAIENAYIKAKSYYEVAHIPTNRNGQLPICRRTIRRRTTGNTCKKSKWKRVNR